MKKFYSLLKKVIKSIFLFNDLDVDPPLYLVLPDHKLIYMVTPKAGCTSIKINIGRNYNIFAKTEKGQEIHNNQNWIKQFRKLSSNYKGYFKFTFIRNPFARLVSCYKDKVVFNGEYNNYYFKDYYFDIQPNISFENFVDIVTKIPDFLADRHFKSQYYSVVKNNPYALDYIGKLENISNDWKLLSKKFSLEPIIEHKNKSENQYNYFEYYNIELVKKVEKKFFYDIQYFGYDNDYKNLLDYVNKKND